MNETESMAIGFGLSGICEDCGQAVSALEWRDHKYRVQARLEELRLVIRDESMSYGEILELQGLGSHIEAGDVELLEWAMSEEEASDRGLI